MAKTSQAISQAMKHYTTLEYLTQHILDFKDSEGVFGVSAYDASRLAFDVRYYVLHNPIRQPVLFVQKRGEEFEFLVEKLKKTHDAGSVKRFFENDELWQSTWDYCMGVY